MTSQLIELMAQTERERDIPRHKDRRKAINSHDRHSTVETSKIDKRNIMELWMPYSVVQNKVRDTNTPNHKGPKKQEH